MLTFERHEEILARLQEVKVVKLAELVEATGASESTIRRDLTDLEQQKKIKRVHGGASLVTRRKDEPSLLEKSTKYSEEKRRIAKEAASLVSDGDTIYIDAGSTTQAMIPHLRGKDIVAITNGLNIITDLVDANIKTYVLGGYVKSGTRAFVGSGAFQSIQSYQFDLAFLGINGVDKHTGYSTPDPEEALIKQQAIARAASTYILADHTKMGDVTFAKVADLKEASLITSDKADEMIVEQLKEQTAITVVKET
ncbi:DeoR/GlpR family DNA-binding transcription regulator [Alteribacter keqinensis]|uniref:DeoR/GlpR transcriptional regulator n=1 Tax=Alteribacter keqinensis TaxID=2483800 RepID=A0A3M7U1A5_9BACI|nr:DeoR/GlpR family DNA-binding transcription regulator [Alteribacter keqinensis]RNA70455.1 DeoR/GlpR transcriptional regulator [Alteribacter keqinensis]